MISVDESPRLGWLSPDGNFVEVVYGRHQKFAEEYCDWAGLSSVAWKLYQDKKYTDIRHLFGDFLVYEQGWILIDAPSGNICITRDESKHMSKAQKEFLYQYLIDNNELDMARDIYK